MFAGYAAAATLALGAATLGSLFMGVLALVGGPVIGGVIWASVVGRRRVAVSGGAITGVLAVWIAIQGLAGGGIGELLSRAPGAYWADAPGGVISGILRAILFSSSVLGAPPLVAVLLAGAIGGLAAWSACLALEAARGRRWLGHAPAGVVIAIVVLGMLAGAGAVDPGAATEVVSEPGSFGYDAVIYRQAHALMVTQDLGYYEAIVTAASHDKRLQSEGAVVDGRFQSWATSPSFIRLPYLFWLWQGARAVGLNVYTLSMLVAVALLVSSYWALWPRVSYRAVAAPALLFPIFITHATWVNIFFPDYWAGMLALGALLLAIRERWYAAGALALAAALCREVAAITLVFLAVGALAGVYLDRDKTAWRHIAFYAGAGGVLALAVYVHGVSASPLIAEGVTPLAIGWMLSTSAARRLAAKFGAPGGYLLYPYGFYAIPPAAGLLAAPVGYLLALRTGTKRVLATLLAAALFWSAFTLTVGAPSSYWGQHYSGLMIVGCALLLAWATRFVDAPRKAWLPAATASDSDA